MASARSSRAFATESSESSEAEDDIRYGATVALPSVAEAPPVVDSAALMKIMHGLQLQADDQRQLAKELQHKLHVAEQQSKLQSVSAAAASVSATSSSKRATPGPSNISAQPASTHVSGSTASGGARVNQDVARLPDEDSGKDRYFNAISKFCLLHSPWVSSEDLTRNLGSLSDRTREAYALNRDERRFQNEESRALGFTAEIYHFFPAVCHEGLRHSHNVQKLVRDTLSNKRSTTVHTMRGHFDRIFSAIPEHTRNVILMKTFEDNPEAKYWVCGNDEEQAKGKGWAGIDYPPCYYPPGKYKKRKLVFQTEWIVNVIRILLWGPSALRTETQQDPAPNSAATLLDLDDITAGAIAFACVIVRYLLGPDTSFTEIGQNSKLATKVHFFAIRNFLLQAHCVGLKWVADLFAFVRERALPPSRKARLEESLPHAPAVAVADHDEAQRRLATEDPSDSSDSEADASVDYGVPLSIPDNDTFVFPSASDQHLTPEAAAHTSAPQFPRSATVASVPIDGVPRRITLPANMYDDMPPLMPPPVPVATNLPRTPGNNRGNTAPPLALPTAAQVEAPNHASFAATEPQTMGEGVMLTIRGEPCRVFTYIEVISADRPASPSASQATLGEPALTAATLPAGTSSLLPAAPAALSKPAPKPRPKAKTKAAPIPANTTTTADITEPVPVSEVVPEVVPATKAPRRSRRGMA